MLPEPFLKRMQEMLGEEYPQFLACYDKPERLSLRINLLKKKAPELVQKTGFIGEPVPWAGGGYYYKEETRPGKHPYHEAGLYYIQEASAMAPAAYLNAQPGDRVLDLCAAPGGKSTQLAADMRGEGLLVCNEIHPARARILSENIERMGICSALVLNHEPGVIARRFPAFFDKVLVDAPCSGEGMFRKNEEAVVQWSPENVRLCTARQDEILECAAGCLKPGGFLMYSTCTFAPEEDEGTISRFLENHPEFHIEEINKCAGMEPGNPGWVPGGTKELEKTVRLWPHKLQGEGHFMALLQKEGERLPGPFLEEEPGIPLRDCGDFAEFAKQYLRGDLMKSRLMGKYLRFGDQLYLAGEHMPSLKGLKVLRPGLHLGTLKKNRFEPSHALALSLTPEETLCQRELSLEEAQDYLKGYTLSAQGEKGWYLITLGGSSLGWGKLAGGVMKNHYPKGLRR